jgi:predicted nucleic acid-binding protein
VALRAIHEVPERDRVRAWFDDPDNVFISSRLLKSEIIRVLRRDRRPLSDADALLDKIGLVDITRATHARAEAIERHIKTLDALHLATVLGLPVTPVIATHESQMRDVAQALGLAVFDPVIDSA